MAEKTTRNNPIYAILWAYPAKRDTDEWRTIWLQLLDYNPVLLALNTGLTLVKAKMILGEVIQLKKWIHIISNDIISYDIISYDIIS